MNSRVFASGVLAGMSLAFFAAAPAIAQEDDDKLFYYLGTVISENLAVLELNDEQVDEVLRGLRAGVDGSAEELDPSVYAPRLQAFTQQKATEAAQREAAVGTEYVAKMGSEEGARTLESGVVYRELEAGSGARPVATSVVKAHYHGTLRDGTVFDSSISRGQPLTIGLNQVIPCWTDGIAQMKVGGKAKLTCPAETAYGSRGSGAIPPNAALTFEVELLEIVEAPAGS